MLQLFRQAAQSVLGQSLAFRALHGHVLRLRLADVFMALFDALVTGIVQRSSFVTMQQSVRLRNVGDVACCGDNSVH